eukprot:jgi/Mesen1/3206/ME000185S02342
MENLKRTVEALSTGEAPSSPSKRLRTNWDDPSIPTASLLSIIREKWRWKQCGSKETKTAALISPVKTSSMRKVYYACQGTSEGGEKCSATMTFVVQQVKDSSKEEIVGLVSYLGTHNHPKPEPKPKKKFKSNVVVKEPPGLCRFLAAKELLQEKDERPPGLQTFSPRNNEVKEVDSLDGMTQPLTSDFVGSLFGQPGSDAAPAQQEEDLADGSSRRSSFQLMLDEDFGPLEGDPPCLEEAEGICEDWLDGFQLPFPRDFGRINLEGRGGNGDPARPPRRGSHASSDGGFYEALPQLRGVEDILSAAGKVLEVHLCNVRTEVGFGSWPPLGLGSCEVEDEAGGIQNPDGAWPEQSPVALLSLGSFGCSMPSFMGEACGAAEAAEALCPFSLVLMGEEEEHWHRLQHQSAVGLLLASDAPGSKKLAIDMQERRKVEHGLEQHHMQSVAEGMSRKRKQQDLHHGPDKRPHLTPHSSCWETSGVCQTLPAVSQDAQRGGLEGLLDESNLPALGSPSLLGEESTGGIFSLLDKSPVLAWEGYTYPGLG